MRGDFIGLLFEVVNMVGKGLCVVGFWLNVMGCLFFVLVGNVFISCVVFILGL